MEIRHNLRRSCGQAKDNTVKYRSTRCTQKRNEASRCTCMGAGCAGYSTTFRHTEFMQTCNSDLDRLHNSICCKDPNPENVSVRLTVSVSCGGWERGLAVETGRTPSQTKAEITRRVPQVGCTLCWAATIVITDCLLELLQVLKEVLQFLDHAHSQSLSTHR